MAYPAKYKTASQMQTVIDQYFEDCKGEMLKDKDGKPVLNKWGEPVIVNARPPTVTGLCIALGFTNRHSLLNYQGKPAFKDTVDRAKFRIEEYNERRLYDKDGCRGAMFNLTNNFRGWSQNPKADETEETLKKLAELLTKVDNAAQS